MRVWRACKLAFVVNLGVAAAAQALVTATPSSVTVAPGQTSATIAVGISGVIAAGTGSAALQFTGLPGGVTTVPVQPGYSFFQGPVVATVNLQFSVSLATPPGTYLITVTDPVVLFAGGPINKPSAGSTVVTLTVVAPGIMTTVSPNPVTLALHGPPQTVTVTTVPSGGFTGPVTYSFTGLPNFVTFGGPQTTDGPGYPPLMFPFSLGIGAAVGTYRGQLVAANARGQVISRQIFSVIVSAPPPPVATAIVPTTIQQGTSGQFTLSGQAFLPGAMVSISGGDVTVTSTTVVSATTIQFSATASETAPPGTRNVVVSNPDGQQSGPVSLQVILRPPPVAVAVTPPTIQQGTSGQFTLTGQGFLPGATLSIAGGDVSLTATTVVSATTIQFSAAATDTAPPGGRNIVVTNKDGQQSGPVALQVILRPPPTIAVISPTTIQQGVASQLVTVTGGNYLGGATVTVTPSAGISVTGVTVVSPNQIQFVITIDPNAPPGVRTVTVTNRDGQSSNVGTFQVLPKPPTVLSVAPPALVLGTAHAVLNVGGDNFREGVTAAARSAAVTVEGTTRISPTLARVQVSVRTESSAIGPVLLEMRNPDGGVSTPPGTLLIYPAESLGAPLAVTAVAITFPLPGAFIGPDEVVYPKGLLATSGTGVVIGAWLLDGVAFDRFTVPSAGGLPAKIPSSVPIPISYTGAHTLALAIENPATDLRAEVPVIRSERKASGLKLYAPEDGAVIGAEAPVFRWSLVPGAFAYEVEVDRGLPELPLFFTCAEAEWHPTRAQLAEIGPGARRWRVRAVFAGGVLGEPTESRRLAVLPEAVHLSLLPPDQSGPDRRFRVRWRGGSPGVLYKVELFPVGVPPTAQFSALTARQEYVLPATLIGGWAFRVRVTAYGPGGRVLGRSESGEGPSSGAWEGVPRGAIMLAAAPPQIQSVAPPDGGTVTTPQPVIEAHWAGDVQASDVLLLVDETDVTPVSTLVAGSIAYGCLLPLDAGSHAVRLTVAGQATSWSFTVSPEAAPAPEAVQTGAAPAEVAAAGQPGTGQTAAGQPAPDLRHDWQLGLQGGVTYVSEDPKTQPDNAVAQFSAQGDLGNGTLSAKATGDVAVTHELQSPGHTVQQSRSWLTNFGAQEGGFQQKLAVGYAAPSFVEGAELLTTGVARGGGEAILATPGPVASFYYSPSNRPLGVAGANFGAEQKVTAVALETPATLQFLQLRAIGLKTVEEAGFSSPGGEGQMYGLFGRIGTSPGFGLIFEAARGKFTPAAPSTETEREGDAYRIGVTGTKGTFSYALNLRRTEANFVNPASGGLTVGGVADRQGADLTLTKGFGLTTVSLQLRHIRSGDTSKSTTPPAQESGAVAQLSSALSQKVTFQVGANVTTNSGDADVEHSLPKTDNRTWGANATLAETLGTLSLSEAVTYQDVSNAVMPDAAMTMKGATVTAGGQLVPTLAMAGTAGFTRTEGSANVGRNDQKLLSLQPNWTIPSIGLSLQPLVAFNESESSLTSLVTRTWQFQLAVSWAPPALGSYASLQLTGAWNRTEVTGQPMPPFQRRLGVVVNIQWGGNSASGGAPAAPEPVLEPATPPPGTVPGAHSALNRVPPLPMPRG